MRAVSCCQCYIIPPYLLEKYAKSDNSAVRDRAIATLREMSRLRAMRSSALGRVSVSTPATAAAPKKLMRRVFSCEGTDDLSRKLMLSEGDSPSNDVATQEAYDFAGLVWEYFDKFHNRNSIDDRGMTLISSVHYSENGEGFDNALWDTRQMIYGDGGEIFGRMTQCLDVVGHELTHGITQYSASLPYEFESGALNEHFSDVMGVVVRQWHEKQKNPKTANWLIGDKLLLNGQALRSMSNPGHANDDDFQPAHMDDFVHMPIVNDGGGVHVNSGIPNKAFYLAAVAIGGPAWETAARIWYITLTQRLRGVTSFKKCALETVSVARDFFGDDIARKVSQAWFDVGVLKSAIGPVASLGMATNAPKPGGAVVREAGNARQPRPIRKARRAG